MTTRFPNQCQACQRLTDAQNGVCTSFPQGIPRQIFALGADHRQSLGSELPFLLDPARRDLFEQWLQWAGEAQNVS